MLGQNERFKKRIDYSYLGLAAIFMTLHIQPWFYPLTEIIALEVQLLIKLILMLMLSIIIDIYFRKQPQSLFQKLTLPLHLSLFTFFSPFYGVGTGSKNPEVLPLLWIPLFLALFYTMIVYNIKSTKLINLLKYSFLILIIVVYILNFYTYLKATGTGGNVV